MAPLEDPETMHQIVENVDQHAKVALTQFIELTIWKKEQ